MNGALTLASSLLLPLALPNEVLPAGSTVAGLVALVPVFLVVYRVPLWRNASRHGLLFGAVSTLLGNYWLAFFGEFSVWTIGGVVVAYAGFNYVFFGFLHFIAHNGAWRVGRSPGAVGNGVGLTGYDSDAGMRALWIAVAWTGYEYVKSVGFLGFPWGLVAYPLSRVNAVAQIAEIGGVWALSFMAAYVNASLAALLYVRDRRTGDAGGVEIQAAAGARGVLTPSRHLAAAVLLIAAAGAFGVWRLATLRPTDQIEMVLVQQNINSWEPGRFSKALAQAQELTLAELSSASEPPDAVVWSETSLRRPYEKSSQYYTRVPAGLPFTEFLKRIQAPLVTGAPMPTGSGGGRATNSALVISRNGRLLDSYAKQQLVPFAERVPLWHLPAVRRFFQEVIGLQAVWAPGTRSEPLELRLSGGNTIAVGTPICFEDSFGWVSRDLVRNGAELLINLTNNSWSRQDSAQLQHFAAARLRTIELRTTLVRSTNSGLTTVVDAGGVASQSLPMFTAAAGRVSVPLYGSRWTLYKVFGDWLGIFAAAGSLLFVTSRATRNERGTRNGDRVDGEPQEPKHLRLLLTRPSAASKEKGNSGYNFPGD